MKILFILRIEVRPNLAGIERVTSVLTKYFQAQGIQIAYLYYGITQISNSESHEGVNIFFLPHPNNLVGLVNKNFIKNLQKQYNPDIVINQGGVDTPISCLLTQALYQSQVKLISVLHNKPFNYQTSSTIFRSQLDLEKHGIKHTLKRLFIKAFSNRNYKRYLNYCRIAYDSSACFVVLSDQYISLMGTLLKTGIEKYATIPNPLSFENSSTYLDLSKKKNQVLFVGRLEYSQKRLDRLLQAWALIEDQVMDWQLVLVGGPGEDSSELYQIVELERLQKLVKTLKLNRVLFAGKKHPESFYRESKIFCLTSSYEGFPMVLGEAMQHGLVPVVFNSFESVSDIINDKENGFLIEPYDIESFANAIKDLVINKSKLMSMAKTAITDAQKFSVDRIGGQWIDLFEKLKPNQPLKS